ncbi:TauD/TfdA dioxygenase family protein [Sphingobium chlorophenolicum]|uniref:Taurine catabolism dioxygenase TauD/TfdA n=1 Tax=Sphingobium chlorophenolicum TaxID=46429 RepID=A0A081RF66_SPHCR|nr:TauD/TfdA family dioxygenase [Sphingobium chlorophenolicum]KEQ53839.1 Taurine catabolism dioxygenase TauD/TfdA [Sphingobium chlorophenolicum]
MSSHSTIMDRDDVLRCTPAHPHFAARAEGIDLRRPLTAEQKAAVKGAMDRYGVVVFPNQMMSDDEQAAFAEQFGAIEETPTLVDQERRRIANMKINDISNLGPDGQIWGADDRRRMYNLGNLLWHSDSSFKPTPAYWSMLQARVIPPVGGATEYIDTRVAWDHLPDELKAIAKDLVAYHSLIYSREQMGFDAFSPDEVERCTPVPQRLVRLHKESGRLALYLSAHIGAIEGWPRPEAMALIRELTEFATQRPFVYAHQWAVGDLVIWDNRCTMHRGTRFDDKKYPRDMRRVTLEDSAPTLEQPI